MEVVE